MGYINRKMLLLNLFAGQEWSYTLRCREWICGQIGEGEGDELRE